MSNSRGIRTAPGPVRNAAEMGGARGVLLAAVCFALGAGAGAYWIHRMDTRSARNGNQPPDPSAVSALESAAQQSAGSSGQQKNWTPPPAAPAAPDVIADVKRLLPNYATVSLDEGLKTLQRASLDQFGIAVNEMQNEVTAAEQQLTQARNGGSDADQQAAMKKLQDLQTGQVARLRDISATNKARLDAFKQLKAAGK